jgi:anti-anti-sigma factor
MLSRSQSLPARPPGVEPFRCVVACEGNGARIEMAGELDGSTVPILRAALDALRDGGLRNWIIDLSGLEFMDSSGLRCILEYHAQSEQHGLSIALISGPPAVDRVFAVTSTRAHLPFVEP